MDIIGYRFQEVMYQQKSTWRELVIFTERELEVLNSSVLYREREFIVSRSSSDSMDIFWNDSIIH